MATEKEGGRGVERVLICIRSEERVYKKEQYYHTLSHQTAPKVH